FESPIIKHGHEAEPRSGSFGQQLPRHKVAVVLHSRQENHVSFANKSSAPRLRHEIDAFSGATREDNFVSARSADVICHALSRVFVGFRRARAQCVQSAMDISVFMLIKIPNRLDDRSWFLRGRSAIEIDQKMAVRLFAKNREIFTK